MAVHKMDEIDYLTQEELGASSVSFTGEEYARRLIKVRKKIKLLQSAIDEHEEANPILVAKRDAMIEALEIITDKEQNYYL